MRRVITVLGLGWAGRSAAADLEIAPGEDWCAAVNAAAPGDTITLAEGVHAGVCWISASGEAGAPITVQGADARIVYEGSSSNVVDLAGSHLVLSGLRFGPTNADIDAIKIRSGEDITLSDNRFDRVGGISISANSADTAQITVTGNTFSDLQATGIYLGCHDGSCASAGFEIRGNVLDGVSSTGVGYGMETKLNSYGIIAENTLYDAQGPAIEVYGSEAGDPTVVERNLAIASRASATLEIGGGPALVRNNVVIGGAGAALYVYDYGGRGLVSDVVVQGNTLWGVGGAAVSLSGWAAGAGLRFDDNAVGRDDGGPGLPEAIDGVPMEGNVDCLDGADCWEDAGSWSFWPREDGALASAAATTEPALTEDWCGRARGEPATVGALEPSPAATLPFSPGATSATLCEEEGGGDEGGGDEGGGDEGGGDETGADTSGAEKDGARDGTGCGCASAHENSSIVTVTGLLTVLIVLGGIRRKSVK